VRTAAALLALFLASCADGIAPFTPPVAMTRTLMLGDEIVCTETLFRVGLPGAAVLEVIGWAKRTFTCELRRKTTQVDGGFRK
jgi:hypothetical protein